MISENSGETDFSLSPQETVVSYVNTLRVYLKSENNSTETISTMICNRAQYRHIPWVAFYSMYDFTLINYNISYISCTKYSGMIKCV